MLRGLQQPEGEGILLLRAGRISSMMNNGKWGWDAKGLDNGKNSCSTQHYSCGVLVGKKRHE